MNSYKFDIPIFPLDNVIMLPGSFLPLNIFEKRYLNMVDDTLKKGSRLIGIIQPLMNKKENDFKKLFKAQEIRFKLELHKFMFKFGSNKSVVDGLSIFKT